MKTHKAFSTFARQYSWNTVIEYHSNAKEIWSGYGIQAWTSVSCFDHSCTELLANLGSPLTLRRTWIYALVISNWKTAGTLTFVKTMAVFSTVCHVLLNTTIFDLVYQMPHIIPKLRGQCKNIKHGTFARLYPHHVRGLGAWLKPTGILYLLGESSLAAESRCLRYKYQAHSCGILKSSDSE